MENSVQGVALAEEEEEKLRREQALQRDEVKFRSIFENANDCMFVLEVSGRILDVNKKAVDLFGRTKEELYGKHFARVNAVSPKDVPRLVSGVAEAFARKRAFLTVNVRSKTGEERTLECSGSLMKVGDRPSVLVIARDVSERMRMEEALRESEEKHRSLFELAPDGVLLIDLKGKVTAVNEAFLKATGFSKEEIVGKHFTRLPTAHDTKDALQFLKLFSSFGKGGKIPPVEFPYRRKDGTTRWVEAHPALQIEGGKNVGVQVVLRDITKRKKAEDALRKSESKYRTLLENVPQKIFLKDRNSVYVSCNESYARGLKIESGEIVGKTDYDFYPNELAEKYRADDQRIMESGETQDIEEEYIDKGLKVFVHTVKTPVKDENGNVAGILGIFWDVTERKQMELALEQSEEKYRTQFEEAMDAILVADAQTGIITDCNRAALELMGYEKSELVGIQQSVLHPQEDLDGGLSKTFKQQLSGKEGQVLETRVVTKKGEIRDVAIKANLMEIRGKKVMQGIFRDITENKLAEKALEESEEKYRSLFESARDVILTGNLQGIITNVNKASEEYGFRRDDIIGKNQLEFVDKKYWSRIVQAAAHVAQGGTDAGEIEIVTPKGMAIAEYKSNPIAQDNKVVGFQTVLHDITERKALEERLKQYSEHLEEIVQKRTNELLESEKRYSVLVEEASDGVAILQDGKVVFVNRKAYELLGYSKDEVVGLALDKLLDEKYFPYAMELYMGRLRGENKPATAELVLIAKTGESVPIEVSGTLINHQGNPAVLVILRDARERKRLEEARLRLEKLAAIGELATMVGHDLRNPLQSIENAAYFLNQELPKYNVPPKTVEMLHTISSSIDYADKIIRDLQDFSATKPPTLEKTDINTIVKETLSQTQIPKNIELHTELVYLPEMKADKDQMKRVFLNLTQNAIQAMEHGGKLTVSTEKTEAFVEVSFKDTGVGIPNENLQKLFTPLFTTKAKGMGMGLPICKKFIENHGGSIEVESQEGKGSTFTIKLPITPRNGGEKR